MLEIMVLSMATTELFNYVAGLPGVRRGACKRKPPAMIFNRRELYGIVLPC